MKERYDFAKAAEYALAELDKYNDSFNKDVDSEVVECGQFNAVLGIDLSCGLNVPLVTNHKLYVFDTRVKDCSIFMFALPYGDSGYVASPDFWADLTLGGITRLTQL